MTTVKQARDILRPLGIALRRTPYEEYRVNFYKGSEGTAYYTDDLDDAVATGRSMAAHRVAHGSRSRRSRYGSTELQTGKFYAYKGHRVWLDAVPGGYFAMVEGTAVQARGTTQGEALKRLREKLDAGAANYTRRRRRR